MKILITGVAGFIGSNLLEFFLSQNHEVFGIDNFITGSKKNIEQFKNHTSFHFWEKDLLDFDTSEFGSIDIVYHLASPASPPQYKKYPVETLLVNSLGTKKLLESVKKNGSGTFVLASTSEIYGNPLEHPQTETYWGNVNPVGERSCYDEAKRFSEALSMAYFRTYRLDIRIARIFNTYGPHMEKNDGRVISNFVNQALENIPLTIYGDGSQTRSFCYVSDMVRALCLLGTTQHISGEIINLGNSQEKSILEIARLIQAMTKTQSQITFQKKGADDPERRKPDISKAQKLLQWNPEISLEEGLSKTIEYFKSI